MICSEYYTKNHGDVEPLTVLLYDNTTKDVSLAPPMLRISCGHFDWHKMIISDGMSR